MKNNIFLNIYLGIFLRASKSVNLPIKLERMILEYIDKHFEEMTWEEAIDYYNKHIF